MNYTIAPDISGVPPVTVGGRSVTVPTSVTSGCYNIRLTANTNCGPSLPAVISMCSNILAYIYLIVCMTSRLYVPFLTLAVVTDQCGSQIPSEC